MKEAVLALTAAILFNMGGSLFLAGVYPGGATGYIRYPNGTIVGFSVAQSSATIYPGAVVLDEAGRSALMILGDGLLAYTVGDHLYPLGSYRKTLPPYRVYEGYAVVGNRLVYANGTMLVYPLGYTPVGLYHGSIVLDAPQGLMLVSERSALLYPGIHPLAICPEGILVSANKTLGVLSGSTITLYKVDGYRLSWGGTLDWSTAACIQDGIAYTSTLRDKGKVVVVVAKHNYCRIYYTDPPAKAVGIASNGTRLTIAFQVVGDARIATATCNASVVDVEVKVVKVSPPEPRVERLRRITAHLEGLRVERGEFRPSPVSDNLLLAFYEVAATVYHKGGRGKRGTETPILLTALAIAALAAFLLARRRRSAESALQH